MAEAAQSLSSKEVQSQTLALPVLADENGIKLNEGNESMVSTGGTKNGEEAGEGYKAGNESIVSTENTVNGNGFGGTKNGEEASEGYKGNIVFDGGAVDKSFEPPIGDFWGKYADDEDDKYDDNEGLDFTKKGLDKKVVEKAFEPSYGEVLGVTGEGFNGKIIQDSGGNGRVVIGDQEAETLFKSSNEEILSKGAENEVELEKVENEGESKEEILGKDDENQEAETLFKSSNEEILGKEDENVMYSVGDLVWSKFSNSHPWWPAQIYDPSDASDHAKKLSHRGKKLLVAYFGDGSFSWRSPPQLKPFVENFDELAKQDDSMLFLASVQSALDEISRVAEVKMTCPCIPEAKKAGLKKKAVVNFGIKEGALGPDCDLVRVPFPDIEPAQMLLKLKSIAEAKPVENMFELIGLESCLSAFYRANGGEKLAFYHEEAGIEGLNVLKRCDLSENELSGSINRKRKSAAKVMKKADTKKKLKSIEISSKNGGDDEDTSGSRKRKRSKYASNPYTDTKLNVKIFRSKRDLEEAEPARISKIAHVGERMKAAAANLVQFSPNLKKKSSGKSDDVADMSPFSSPGTLEEADQMNLDEMTMAEYIRGKRVEKKKADEGLLFIKEKLKKMTLIVENCGGVMVPELKLNLENEVKELLEKISSMEKP